MEMKQPHILILPFPAQGHVKPMLTLAELLCHAAVGRITFINTHYIHNLLANTTLKDLSARFPALHFESISDGLPDDNPRTVDHFLSLISSINNVTKNLFRELLISYGSGKDDGSRPVTCIIAHETMSFAIDVAKEFDIPVIVFCTTSACYQWSMICAPKLIEEGHIPFSDEDLDKEVTGVPGLEGIVRYRDLPSICRFKMDNPVFKSMIQESKNIDKASVFILNTFQQLEGPILSHIDTIFPKTFPIGPLQLLLTSFQSDSSQSCSSSKCSLMEVDNKCLAWLDSQPERSVIYVSFGSLVRMQREEVLEFWHRLINSGKSFLWVLRQDMIASSDGGDSSLPEELKIETEKGYIVKWAPQEDVLVHRAVGGFLTHSGWNSTLEAIAAGVPMLCWPKLGDQQTNSRWVSEVWKIGYEMKDTCDRVTIEKMVRELMEEKREEVTRSMDDMSRMARDCVKEGGSSFVNFEKLIDYIRSMS